MIQSNYHLLNRLVNKEFPGAYRQIVTHLEGVEFAAEDVQLAFNAVKAKVANLDYIKSNLVLHPLTAELAKLNEERHQHLLSLKGRVVYAKKSPIAEERKAAKTLHVWISREHDSFTSKNMERQNDAVHRIEHDLTIDLEMINALETLGISSTVDHLVNTTSQILSHTMTRRDEKRATTSRSRALRREAYLAMKAFVMTIEVAVVLKKGDDVEHFSCLTKIKDVVTDFYTKHQSRVSRQRNAAEEARAEANKNANYEHGEQSGDNVVPLGGKLATTSRSVAFGVKTLNDMDLQSGDAATYVAMKGAPAMNESVTSGDTLGGNNRKASNSTASANGASQIGNGALDNISTDDETAARHKSVHENENSDQES